MDKFSFPSGHASRGAMLVTWAFVAQTFIFIIILLKFILQYPYFLCRWKNAFNELFAYFGNISCRHGQTLCFGCDGWLVILFQHLEMYNN